MFVFSLSLSLPRTSKSRRSPIGVAHVCLCIAEWPTPAVSKAFPSRFLSLHASLYSIVLSRAPFLSSHRNDGEKSSRTLTLVSLSLFLLHWVLVVSVCLFLSPSASPSRRIVPVTASTIIAAKTSGMCACRHMSKEPSSARNLLDGTLFNGEKKHRQPVQFDG